MTGRAFHGAWADLRFGVRGLRRHLGFTVGTATLLALGFGVSAGVSALAYGVLRRPLPYSAADRLAIVTTVDLQGRDYGVRRNELAAWLDGFRLAEGAAAYRTQEAAVGAADQMRFGRVAYVSPGFFDLLGVVPSRGRAALADGGVVAAAALARGMPEETAPGRTLQIGFRTRVVAGVMPPGVEFPTRVSGWIPIAAEDHPERCGPQSHACLSAAMDAYRLLVRVRPGVSLTDLRRDAARLQTEVRGEGWRAPPRVRWLEDATAGPVRLALEALLAVGVLVLGVAGGGAAVLFVNRGLSRREEFAVRRATGASALQIWRAAVVENLLVTAVGLAAGLGLAAAALQVVRRVGADLVPRLGAVAIDGPPVAGNVVLALVLAVSCGTVTGWSACRQSVLASLRGSAAFSSRLGGVRAGLVIVQVTLAVVLLAGGGLLARTVADMLRENTGVDAAGVSVTRMVLSDTLLFDAADRADYVAAVLDGVRRLPGVVAAGIGSNLPPVSAPMSIGLGVATGDGMRSMRFALGSASPGWFRALGARLVAGRGFDDRDAAAEAPGIVLSESAADFLFATGDAVGREVTFRLPPLVGLTANPRVVGIVSDIRYDGLDAPPPAAIYVPWRLRATGVGFLAVRADIAGRDLAPAVRAVVRAADPGLPPPAPRPLEREIAGSIVERRLQAGLVGGSGALTLGVVLVGLAGLLNRVVAERRRELAVRAACGASPRRLMTFVLVRGAGMTVAGLLPGAVCALTAGRLLAPLLHGVAPDDPATLLGALGIVGLASLAACAVPAWRASRVEPAVLRRIA